ncbi:right-handed parallel beta-helix repeat-containing protein [Longimicrobium sp.]|uniref:right-handed parallel beta-helix repeat-containing protein n=1 Tax=Longimicrobium sp. TaxID=2029185 RepID=UPI002B702412|nr:right-handed parallel beta-helix repeat-containing protein [Longimicrobium sp.]HSU15159.1 right-handed parallel beta-helix repeat-containing protein [Longimicrobium sp.]
MSTPVLLDTPDLQEMEGPLAAALYDLGGAVVNALHPDFGAVRDGAGQVTNGTEVLQAAIDFAAAAGGGKVVVPPSVYLLDDWVYVASQVTVEGIPGNHLKVNGCAFRNASFETATDPGTDCDIGLVGLAIEDTSLDPGAEPPDAPGLISLKLVDRMRVERCRIWQTGTNLYLYGIKIYNTVRDSHILHNHHVLCGDFVYMLGGESDNVDIRGNTVRGRRDLNVIPNGISLWFGARRIRVVENDVREIGDEGISVQECSNVLIQGNVVGECDSACIDVRGANTGVDVLGNNCFASNEGQGIIRVSRLSTGGVPVGVNVVGNVVDATPVSQAGPAIKVDGAEDVTIEANTVFSTSDSGSGISVMGGARNVSVSHNTVRAVTIGIEFQGCTACSCIDNYVSGCQQSGIRTNSTAPSRLLIAGNVSSCNGRGAAFRAGIEVPLGDRVRLVGNQCFDDTVPPTQAFSIIVGAAVTNAWILDNDVSQGGLQLAPTAGAVLVRDNRGYNTKASDSVAVAAGTTTKVVSHGMNRDVDSIRFIYVVPRSSLFGAGSYWITDPTPGDGKFTINLENAPTADVSFVWGISSERKTTW